MFFGVVIVAAIGFLISVYGFYVEYKVKQDKGYKAVCDISDMTSCTKTFLSPWGKTLGVSNIYLGLLFYVTMLILGLLGQSQLAFIVACLGMLATLYFAYILYAKVKTLCLICISTYIVNILLCVVTYLNK